MATNRFVGETYNSAGTRLATYSFTFHEDALAAMPKKVGASYRIIDSWKMDMVAAPSSTISTSNDTTGLNQISDPTINENQATNILGVASDTWPT